MKLNTTQEERERWGEYYELPSLVGSDYLSFERNLLADFNTMKAELASALIVIKTAAHAAQQTDTELACGACDDAFQFLVDHPE